MRSRRRSGISSSPTAHPRRLAAGGLALALWFATAGSAPPDGFADGTWHGQMVWVSTVHSTHASGASDEVGEFDVTFAGGAPSASRFASVSLSSGATDVESGSGTAQLTVTIEGWVGGTAESPQLVAGQAHVSGVASAQGISVPVDFTLSESELRPLTLDFKVVGCSAVSGDLSTSVAAFLGDVAGAGLGGDVLEARWSAVRTGAAGLTAEQSAELSELLADATAIEADVEAGVFDPIDLAGILDRAEQFSSALDRNADCGYPAEFVSSLAGVMTIILEAMVATPDLWSASDFFEAIVAGVRAGVIGGATPSPLEGQLSDILEAKLGEAIGNADKNAATAVLLAAGALGDGDLVAAANEAVGQL